MYIGPTDNGGILHLIKEVADNSIDEFSAGRNSKIVVCLDKDVITVADDGAGIPIGKVKDEQTGKLISAFKASFTLLHAGGKFKGRSGYKQAAGTIGTHGIGVKATNALSSQFIAYSYQKGRWFSIAFEKGKLKQDVEKCKRPKLPFGLKKKDCGVVIKFTPDYELFKKGSKVPVKRLKEWAQLSAYINGGLEITLVDNGKTKTWKYRHGIAEYLKHQILELKAGKIGKSFNHTSHHIDLSFQFSDAEGIKLESYTNSTCNNDEGIHYETVTQLIADSLKPYGKKRQKFHKQDLLEGIVGVINVKIDNPQFSSQTKEKLVDIRVKKLLETELPKDLQKFFKVNKNLAKKLCKKASDLRKLKAEFSKKSEALRLLNSRKNKKGLLPSKFASAPRCRTEDRETYLVEGDSAGGCFIGTTKIQLLNGETISFKKLVKDSKKGIIHFGYTMDLDNTKINVTRLKEPHQTKKVDELIEIELSNGYKIRATPEHKFMLRTGEYVTAENLTVDCELMPHTEFISKHRRYVVFPKFTKYSGTPSKRGQKVPVYKLAAKYNKTYLKNKKHFLNQCIKTNIHHIDHNPLNDSPDNLVLISEKEHRILHAAETSAFANFKSGDKNIHSIMMKENDAYRRQTISIAKETFSKYWGDKTHQKEQSERTTAYFKKPGNRRRQSIASKEVFLARLLEIAKNCGILNEHNWYKTKRKMYPNLNLNYDKWKSKFDTFEDFRKAVENYEK